MKRTYIKPLYKGVIFGIAVRCVEVEIKNKGCINPCLKCVAEGLKMCIEDKSLDTRPACFSNDPENLSKKPLYYIEAK